MNRKLLDAQDLPHQYITGVPPSRRNTASSAIVLRVALNNERPCHFFGDTCYMSKVFWISKTFLKLHHFQVAQNLWLNCSILLRISACSRVSNTSCIRIFTYVHHALTTQPRAGLQGIRRWPSLGEVLHSPEDNSTEGPCLPQALYPLIVCHRSLLAFVGSLLISLQQVFTVIVLDIKGVLLRF